MQVSRNEERGKERPLWERRPDVTRTADCRHQYSFILKFQVFGFGPVKVFACTRCGQTQIY